jgi:hypothetical protein
VQPCLYQRMIKQTVLFAPSHKSKASKVGEHRAQAILPIKPQQGAFWWELACCEIPTNGRERLAQFLSIATVPAIAKTAEPVVVVSLRHDGARPDDLPALASRVTRGTDLIQPAKGWGQIVPLW